MLKRILFIILILPVFLLFGCISDSSMNETPGQLINPATTPPIVTPPPSEGIQTPDQTPELTPQETLPTPVFGFIDAHADTVSRVFSLLPSQISLYSNDMDVDFLRLSQYPAPVQVFVLWTSNNYIRAAFEHTNQMLDFLESEIEKHSEIIEIALSLDDIIRIAGQGKISALIAIEGGEALEGKIENLDHFYERGVRILAPTWNRENELGYGQATGSTQGLKPFGIECIQRMDELGMILDVSHLNETGFWDAHNTSTRPYMASHSNAYAILPHNRNLKDEQITAIVDSGGIIGFNMFPPFIAQNGGADMDDIMAHFRHFIQLGAGNHIVLGCDFDGISSTPEGIVDVLSLKMLGDTLTAEFDAETSFKIMQGNFYEFFKRYYEG